MFFDSTPNILYPDFFESGSFKLSKNLFRRIRPRDSVNAIFASAQKYIVTEGETPDSIAYSMYGSSSWYWTILILNNITDINEQWPLEQDELDKVIANKYGDYENSTRHWETNEIKNADGDVVLEGGIVIEVFMDREEQRNINYWPDWSFTYIDKLNVDNKRVIESSEVNTVTASMNLTRVTNREYEYYLNEMKKEIYLPRTDYLDKLAIEVKELLRYETEYKLTPEGYRIAEEP